MLEIPSNFIHTIIKEDLESKKHNAIVTRFPPEPNGYLHIGHAKSICLNFGVPKHFIGAICRLRFDDTNPVKEDMEYIRAIEEDVRWLGFQWEGEIRHASDYFDQIFNFAIELIKKGKAYVCSLSQEETRKTRGTLTEAGTESPYRTRSVEENLDLFYQMRDGKLEEGACVLRAKIDMKSGNINMRDPVIYRILKASHPRTKDKWCIYPMYDFTHCLSDALELVTHSLCTLEFQDHRPLYDWFIDELSVPCKPRQIEFAKLNLNYTITSKRKLKELVDKNFVSSWSDPRMPTLSGLRKRGYTPKAIRNFCELIGVAKKETTIDMGILEESLRQDLNEHANRVMCVLDPLKITITNYDAAKGEVFITQNHPQDPSKGEHEIPFHNTLWIEREDFEEVPPKKFFRLFPGAEVRLRHGYIIKCNDVIKDQTGKVIELKCSYDPDTLGKNPTDRKIKGVIHWVSAKENEEVEINLYDRLFKVENPGKLENFLDGFNEKSSEVLTSCYCEKSITQFLKPEVSFQFERKGYFMFAGKNNDKLVFNRSVTLRDTWQA